MARFPTEEESLKAISELQVKFPYAATLLIYTVLERFLKLHLLKKRETLTVEEVKLEHKVNARTLRQACELLNDADFIQLFLVHCTLGTLEIIFYILNKRYSDARNNVIHSNRFLGNQRNSDYLSRDEENRELLEKAKAHLIEASKLYFRDEIIESDGSLGFKANLSAA